MDMSRIAKKLGFSESKQLILHAAELRRLADIQFDSSIIGIVSFFHFSFVFWKPISILHSFWLLVFICLFLG